MAVKRRRKKRAARKAAGALKEKIASKSADQTTKESAQEEWNPDDYLSGAWKEELRDQGKKFDYKFMPPSLDFARGFFYRQPSN